MGVQATAVEGSVTHLGLEGEHKTPARLQQQGGKALLGREQPVRSNRKSFCNCTNGKRKAEKALVCCIKGRKDLNR